MKKTLILVSISVALAIICSNAARTLGAESQSIELNYAVFVPPMHVMNIEAQAWGREVEKRTASKVKINVHPGSTLLKPSTVYQGVIAGSADIAVLPCSYNRALWPISMALNYCNLRFPSANVGTHVINDLYKKYKEAKEFSEMKMLYFFTCDTGAVASNKPIRTVEDARGIEVKATGPEFIKLLGASLVGMPMSEVAVGLQKGTIDAAVISYDVLKGMRLADVVKYVSPNLQMGTTAFWVGMNIDKWNSLAPDIKRTIEKINTERIGIVGRAWDKAGEEGVKYAKSLGVEFISWPPEEDAKLQKLFLPIREDYIKELNSKGLPGREIIETVLELADKRSKEFSE